MLYDGRSAPEFVSMNGGPLDWPSECVLTSKPNGRRSNNLVSRFHFRNARVHVEFRLPADGEGNSGIYLHGLYEVQIRGASPTKEPGLGDLGAIYGLQSPGARTALGRGHWQAFDICFVAPQRDAAGQVTRPGSITVWLNQLLIHNCVPIGERASQYNPYSYDTTEYLAAVARRQFRTGAGPLLLQDHDSPVQFRNIWILPLDDRAGIYDPDSDLLLPRVPAESCSQ